MDMDDPWGSPWGDEVLPYRVTPKPRNALISPAKLPPAFALDEKTNSPWGGEDDTYGEWGVAMAKDDRENVLELGGVDVRREASTAEEDKNNCTADTSNRRPILSQEIKSTYVDSFPKPALDKARVASPRSPDPWASKTTLNDDKSKDGEAELNGKGREAKDPGDSVLRRAEGHPGADKSSPQDIQDDAVRGITARLDSTPPSDLDHSNTVPKPVDLVDETSNIQEGDLESSRPSLSPSEHSHHEEILQESPRTSLDEEPRRPHGGRTVSSKVQELVEHFDGLARRRQVKETDASPVDHTPFEDRNSEVEDEDVDEFGDFENEGSESSEPFVENNSQPCEIAKATDESFQTTSSSNVPGKARESSQSEGSSPSHASKLCSGSVEFDIATTALAKLFPGSETEFARNEAEGLFIPDTIPYDSFSSTSQRKTWYRVSRYGTMRKYNTGDDENYIRVNWAQSDVRLSTLRIVARWMEEDRMSGGIVLGGKSKGGSVFGWNDTNLTPITISSAFAAKRNKKRQGQDTIESTPEVPREWPKGLVRAPSTPKSHSRVPSTARRRGSSKTMHVSEEEKPAPNFGWSSIPSGESKEESKAQISLPDILVAGSTAKSGSVAAKVPIQKSTLSAQASPPETIPAPQRFNQHTMIAPLNEPFDPSPITKSIPNLPLSLTIPPASNDDEDWGELISSPTVVTPQALPPSKAIRHKKSQSLRELYSPGTENPFIADLRSPPLPGQGHRSTVSFDEILAPKIESLSQSNINPFPVDAFSTNTSPSFVDYNAEPVQATIPPAAIGNVDPWASADFSFFETSTAPLVKGPYAPRKLTAPSKPVTLGNPGPTVPPKQSQKSREQIEQDRIVERVVKGLPNLSYMLRR